MTITPAVIKLPDNTLEGRARIALARLDILMKKLEYEGAYTRALSAGIAYDVIEDLLERITLS